jgi:putative ABC transport system ATP-binding protein
MMAGLLDLTYSKESVRMINNSARQTSATPEGTIAVVAAYNLTRRYGEGDAAVEAIKDVSIDFQPGTFTAIMGPSGSGKSTLLHLLAGLDRPTCGTVTITGIDITQLSDTALTVLRRQKIGFVFQFFNLLPMLTVEENIVLPLRIGGQKIDQGFVTALIERMGLADRRKYRPAQLSGGQQQRVAIARALVTKPAVIFADEPTGNLDSKMGQELLTLLRHAVDELGQTIIMVTHDPSAAAVADRIVFLADGQVIRDQGRGSVEHILDMLKELS